MAENEQDPAENEPIEQDTSQEGGTDAVMEDAVMEDAVAEDAVEEDAVAEDAVTEAAETAPVLAASPEEKQHAEHNRTTMILGGVIIILVALLCFALASTLGLGLGGSAETPTPAPIPTPVPTPEPGNPPTAVIYAPNTGIVGIPITFDGSGSAGAVPIVSYDWDFGDGTGARGAVVQHIYNNPGNYTVTLTVVDDKGLSDNASMRIDISAPEPSPEPEAPTAAISAPTSAVVGETVNFNGSESFGENPIVNYSWDFGDRTSGSGAVVQHVYGESGTYKVTLTVTDNIGLSGNTTTEIVISNLPQTGPTAVITGPSQAVVGEQVTYDASGSVPGSSDITNYTWGFGDGKTNSGRDDVLVNTTFDTPGRYTVTLTVSDENGLSNTASMETAVNSSVENTSWSLTQVLPGTEITAQFDRGKLSGFSGCNDYSGSYVTTGDSLSGGITISDITATRSACADDIMAQEAQYLTNLQSASSYTINGSTLSMATAGAALSYVDASTLTVESR